MVLGLRMSGAMSPLPYIFMAHAETAIPFHRDKGDIVFTRAIKKCYLENCL
jgi:hypothetical protein